jgi:cyclopropane fatty-acyl-phospholipid synthase-like methyltransferase
MDDSTLRYYEANARRLTDRYEAADVVHLHALLAQWIKPGQRVLEIGCGCGRDAAFIASLGCDVIATDASPAMLDCVPHAWRAAATFRQAAFPLPGDDPLFSEQFDVIVAIAVLMHIPESDIAMFAQQVRALLKPNGRFICSFCAGRESSLEDPRLYVHRERETVVHLLQPLGLRLASASVDPDDMGRQQSWTSLVFCVEAPLI